MSDVSYSGPLNDWMVQAPPQPPPRVFGKSLASLLGPYLGDPNQTQAAAEAAAQRVRAPYAAANARESGLPQLGEYFGNKVASALTAPRDAFTGAMPVNDPATGMPTPEAMQRGQGVANLAMTGGIPMSERGAVGMAGGRLGGVDPLASLREAGMQAAQPGVKANLPPPKKLLDRTWDNYTKRMTEDEALQSEPVWGAAQRMADEHGTSHASAFARVMNDWYARKGIDKHMSEDAANAYTGRERANAQFGALLKEPDVGRLLTSKGRVVDRTEAGRIADQSGPLFAENLTKHPTTGDPGRIDPARLVGRAQDLGGRLAKALEGTDVHPMDLSINPKLADRLPPETKALAQEEAAARGQINSRVEDIDKDVTSALKKVKGRPHIMDVVLRKEWRTGLPQSVQDLLSERDALVSHSGS